MISYCGVSGFLFFCEFLLLVVPSLLPLTFCCSPSNVAALCSVRSLPFWDDCEGGGFIYQNLSQNEMGKRSITEHQERNKISNS